MLGFIFPTEWTTTYIINILRKKSFLDLSISLREFSSGYQFEELFVEHFEL